MHVAKDVSNTIQSIKQSQKCQKRGILLMHFGRHVYEGAIVPRPSLATLLAAISTTTELEFLI